MKILYIFAGCFALLALFSVTTTFSVSAEEETFYKEIIEKLEMEILEMETRLSEEGFDIDRTLQKPLVKEDRSEDENRNTDEKDEEDETAATTNVPDIPRAQKEIEDRIQTIGCVSIRRTFRFGDYNEEVTKIQEFLEAKGYFSHPYITPYFGPVTEKAVQDFQRDKGIVSHGTPSTTGFGQVGPRTIKAMEMESCPSNNWGS